ncbi:MAG TPA: hypothetical protein VGY77_09255 [Gemmataceae bacterium]|jgi:hypothetical protein|nr:hypothetical protein [Gemmataceae bacterium]
MDKETITLGSYAMLVLRSLVFLLAIFGFFVASFSFADQPKDNLKEKVDQLVQQLGDQDSEKQAAAAAALLKLGPQILPLLPKTDGKLSANQKKHLEAIHRTIQDARALKEIAPKTVTIQNKSITFADALKEITQQTGMKVMDRRRDQDALPRFALDLSKVTFWEAMDEIALKADLRISLYEREGGVAFVDGPHQTLPVSHSGVFRIAVKRLVSVRDLETEHHVWLLHLEIAWEPRFQPLFLEIQPDKLVVKDGKGVELKNIPAGSGRAPVTKPLAMETQIRVEAPSKPNDKISLLKGDMTMVGPSKMLTFTFDNLDQIQLGKKGKPRKETQEGVTVNLREFRVEPEIWTFGLLLEYPPEGPEFESFESWLVNNEIFLEKKNGKGRFAVNGGYDDEQAGHKAVFNYRFIDDNNLSLGKPTDWNLIYRTPGTIVKFPIQFEFKDLPVP